MRTQGKRPRAAAMVATVAALAIGLSGCGMFGGGGKPETAAEVEGIPISSARVDELYDIFAKTDQGAAGLAGQGAGDITVSPKQIRALALSYEIRVQFLNHLQQRENIELPDEEADSELYDEVAQTASLQASGFTGQDLALAARAEKIQKAIAAKLFAVEVTDEELQAAFDEREEIVGESFRATTDVAFMDDRESADALIAALDDGEEFFDVTASLGEKTLNADTIQVTPTSPVEKPIIDATRELDGGETLAEPIVYDVSDGSIFVVLHQQKREDLPALRLDDPEVRDELTEIVADGKRFALFEQWFLKQFAEADVDVDGYYGKWNPSFQAVT